MRKMNAPAMELVRFAAEDVIATSHGTDAPHLYINDVSNDGKLHYTLYMNGLDSQGTRGAKTPEEFVWAFDGTPTIGMYFAYDKLEKKWYLDPMDHTS